MLGLGVTEFFTIFSTVGPPDLLTTGKQPPATRNAWASTNILGINDVGIDQIQARVFVSRYFHGHFFSFIHAGFSIKFLIAERRENREL